MAGLEATGAYDGISASRGTVTWDEAAAAPSVEPHREKSSRSGLSRRGQGARATPVGNDLPSLAGLLYITPCIRQRAVAGGGGGAMAARRWDDNDGCDPWLGALELRRRLRHQFLQRKRRAQALRRR